jgi:hypothetical protein
MNDKLSDSEHPLFSYRTIANDKVLISWKSKLVMTLKGKEAVRFKLKIENADDVGKQMIMAKKTGNFKRGNER